MIDRKVNDIIDDVSDRYEVEVPVIKRMIYHASKGKHTLPSGKVIKLGDRVGITMIPRHIAKENGFDADRLEDNIEAGVMRLKELLDKTKNNVVKALDEYLDGRLNLDDDDEIVEKQKKKGKDNGLLEEDKEEEEVIEDEDREQASDNLDAFVGIMKNYKK